MSRLGARCWTVAVALVLWFTTGFPSVALAQSDAAAQRADAPVPPSASPATRGLESPIPDTATLARLAESVKGAVINIATENRGGGTSRTPFEQYFGEQFYRRFFGDVPERIPRRSLGSGVVIDPSGIALTNAHVVQGATRIEVAMLDGTKYQARVLGADEPTDLAVIQIQDPKGSLPVLPLANSDDVRVGEWVLAVGSPFGLEATVTVGIISGKARHLGAGPFDDFLQTDAAVNPGNSGGPLVNMRGEVVGINTAIVAGGSGIGFAIPSNMVKTVATQLRDKGRVARGSLGVVVQPLTPDLAKGLGMQPDEGALVADVQRGSPAARAGIERGDLVVEFGGQKVREPADLQRMVGMTAPGTERQLTAVRNGDRRTFAVQVGEAGTATTARTEPRRGAPPASALGLSVEPLTRERAAQIDSEAGAGVVVINVDRGSPAARAGIRAGDVIREIRRQPVQSVADFDRLTRGMKPGDVLTLRVERDGTSRYVAVPLGRDRDDSAG